MGDAPRTSETRARVVALVGTAVPGMALVATWTHDARVTLLLVLGPLAGGVARHWQSCCAECSLILLPIGMLPLAVGLLAPRFLRGDSPARRRWRLVLWTVGWAAWFLTGLVSYGHALE